MTTNAEEVSNAAAEKLLFYAAQIYCSKISAGLLNNYAAQGLINSSIVEAEMLFKTVAEKLQDSS